MSNESKNKSQAYCITKVYLAYHNNDLPMGRKSFCESIIIDDNIFLKEAKSHAHTHRSIPFQGPGDFQWHQDHRGFLGGFSDPSKKKKKDKNFNCVAEHTYKNRRRYFPALKYIKHIF